MASEAHIKVSGGWLVEAAGFRKGHQSGGVGVCEHHALALVNSTGKGTAADVLNLANSIADAVETSFGIRLRAEPILMGFQPETVSALKFDAVAQ